MVLNSITNQLRKSTLDRHFKNSCKKANTQLKVLARVVPYMRLAQKPRRDNFVFCNTIQLFKAYMDDS